MLHSAPEKKAAAYYVAGGSKDNFKVYFACETWVHEICCTEVESSSRIEVPHVYQDLKYGVAFVYSTWFEVMGGFTVPEGGKDVNKKKENSNTKQDDGDNRDADKCELRLYKSVVEDK